MPVQVDRSRPIPGTTVFDWRESRKGYRLNKFAMAFADAANRDAFKADEEAFMERYALNDQEKQYMRDRDFRGLIEDCGGNIYMIMKIGACTGHGLYHMGAQLRGETFEQFMDSRNAKGAR
ncbi:MAG: protocatechuate 3,4-dioxygenase [Alphaproteobacteria bacterium]